MAKKASANPELDEIIQRPENRTCADCGAKAPRWASVNLGVLVCIDCSGSHRNLGTHISVVKSVTLDKWNAKWIDTITKIGNRIANDYYEREMRGAKLSEGSTLEKRASWIRQKYEKKEWCPRGKLSPSELLAQGRNPDANASGGRNDRSASPDDRRRNDRDRRDDRRRDDDDRRRGDDRRDDRRRDDRRDEQARKPVPAPAAAKPAPTVDLFDLDQPVVAAPVAAPAASSDWAAFPQQGAPQQQLNAVTQQFSNMQMAPTAGLTDVFAPSAPAQPAAQAHMPPQQQPSNTQDQKVDYMKNALASLYQQPSQPADPFAAFNATAPSNMGMGGGMCGAPTMGGYGGMAPQGMGGYGQMSQPQQMPMAPQQGMGMGMGGYGMQQPAMMQQTGMPSMPGGMANGMQMGMSTGMGMSMPSGMPAGAGMSMPSTMPGMGMSMPSGAPAPQQQAALPASHADAMKHVLDGFNLGGNQALSSTNTGGLPSPGSVNIPPAPSSLDIDAFSAFGQTGSQQQQPSGMAAGGMPAQMGGMGPAANGGMGQMGGMNMGMQQPMMGGMQPQQQMGMQQQPMMGGQGGMQQMGGMQQQMGGMPQMGGMQQQMGGMPQMGMQQMMGGAPQQGAQQMAGMQQPGMQPTQQMPGGGMPQMVC